jgi:hypothetical protein
MKRTYFWICFPLMCAALGLVIHAVQLKLKQPADPNSTASKFCKPECSSCIMHVPKGGCPQGWTKFDDAFELEGKSVPACGKNSHQGTGEFCLDVLRGHESFNFGIVLPVPRPEQPTPKVRRREI